MGYISNSNLQRKGLLSFARAGHYAPGINFELAGKLIDESAAAALQRTASPNFKNLGYLSDDRLLEVFQHAKVYAQLSAHEGFGLSLAEAMACGCVPVVTAVGSLPELVGDTGYYVPVDDPVAAGQAILDAVQDPNDYGQQARQRIMDCFPLVRRHNELRMIIAEVLS